MQTEILFDIHNYYVIISFASDDRALVAQLDRAFGYGPKGWEFEPSLVHNRILIRQETGA